MFSLSMLIACGVVGTPETRIRIGAEISLLKNETLKITSATKEDGKIVVVMDLNFNAVTLENFEILLNGYNVDAMDYDREGTAVCNDASVFSKGYVGSVFIVFTDDSITNKQELSEYTMNVIYDDGDTRIGLGKFMLEDDLGN